jgi:S-methylmethionine-dependent homocysteine/selenocysteine methylase
LSRTLHKDIVTCLCKHGNKKPIVQYPNSKIVFDEKGRRKKKEGKDSKEEKKHKKKETKKRNNKKKQ